MQHNYISGIKKHTPRDLDPSVETSNSRDDKASAPQDKASSSLSKPVNTGNTGTQANHLTLAVFRQDQIALMQVIINKTIFEKNGNLFRCRHLNFVQL